jgi:hypothetical protein
MVPDAHAVPASHNNHPTSTCYLLDAKWSLPLVF